MKPPRPVPGIDSRSEKDKRPDEVRASLRKHERHLATEGVRNDRRSGLTTSAEEFGKHVGCAPNTERTYRTLAFTPAWQVGDDHLPSLRENPRKRHEIPPRDAQAVEQHNLLTRASLTNVQPEPEHLKKAGAKHVECRLGLRGLNPRTGVLSGGCRWA